MAEDTQKSKESSSIVDEIEEQLEQTLIRRKREIEKELEERIKKEKEEAEKRLREVDRELAEEKGDLSNFKRLLAEFETNKSDLKKQIKEHIDNAIKFQTEIETLTGQTLEELKKVSDLNQELEELQRDTGQKVTELKNKLEEKFGIVTEVPEEEHEEEEINLEQELHKLRKIRDLLNSKRPADEEEGEKPVEPEEKEMEAPAEEVKEPTPEEQEKQEEQEAPVKEVPEAGPGEPRGEAQAEEVKPEETRPDETQPEEEAEKEAGEEEKAEEAEAGPPPKEAKEEKMENEVQSEQSFQETFEKLETFRKGTRNENDGEVSYFENENRIVLDGECIVATLNNSFEEAKKMYIKLAQTESPKDQFFIKQEIIKQQDTLRKVMLRGIRLCEKENCSLPDYTKDIINLDILKTVLEKVSMENWSNQEDFASFDSFSKELKDAFYSRITPPAAYLNSILKQLEID